MLNLFPLRGDEEEVAGGSARGHRADGGPSATLRGGVERGCGGMTSVGTLANTHTGKGEDFALQSPR